MNTKKAPGQAKAAAKPAVAKAPAASVPTAADAPAAARVRGNALKLKQLIDRVSEGAGAKKKDAKPLVEAVLAELGAALRRGDELNLPGLGRARVVKSADKGEAALLTVKLKVGGSGAKSEKGGKEPLAEEED